MKTKYYFLTALAGVMLAGCSSDDFVAEGPTTAPEGVEGPIVFSSLKGNYTRADYQGADAAALLNNKFVVFGYKGSSTKTPGTTVFDNYAVEYGVNTANTTESNTNNWEYVGVTPIKHATDHGITSQTIKYWDYSKAQYDFIAWSTGEKTPIYSGTPAAGEILVTAIEPAEATSPATGLGTAYTFTGTAADLTNCYISDLVTVKKTGTPGVNTVIGYNQPVTLKFRALGAKVRVGIYETIPGYSVKDVKFYTAANVALATDGTEDNPTLFTTTAGQIYNTGTYSVYFPTVDASSNADNNQAHIEFAGTAGDQKSTIGFNGLAYTIAEEGEKTTGASFLGRTSNTASMAGRAEGNYFTAYLPNESGTNLNLRVNYTLESIDGSGETIEVKGATAQVPSIYAQWKPGYAYTYIFKISDESNGYTGVYDPTQPDNTTVNSDPAGLYPITFDAVVVNDENNDKTQETITTVSSPSITTYQKGSNVVNANEYTVLSTDGNIYVTVNDGLEAQTPDLAHGALQTLTDKAALYTIPAGTTEAEVVDALQITDDDKGEFTIKGRNRLGMKSASLQLTNKVEYGVDGNTVTVANDQAAKFSPTANTTYAFVYTKKAAVAANDEVKYEPVAFGNTAVTTKYRYDYKAATAGEDVQKGVLYFTEDAGVYTKKPKVFIGQGVGNLMVRTGTGSSYTYAQASGYAVTGTIYCYGTTNKVAHNVTFAEFATAELYVAKADGTDYVAKTDTYPVDGKAYYFKETDGSYTYCVILPEQTTGLYVLDTTKYVQATETIAVEGQTYFDKFTVNDGVYYAKVIKVQ